MQQSTNVLPPLVNSAYAQDLFTPYPEYSTPTSSQSIASTFNNSTPFFFNSTAAAEPLPLSVQPCTTFTCAPLNGITRKINHGQNGHGPTVAVSTSTVTQHILEFTGDHRSPPIRPPIPPPSADLRSRPNQTTQLITALTNYADRSSPPPISEETVQASVQHIFQLLNSTKVATNSITSKQLEPYITPETRPTSLDPCSFCDPEHECHNIVTQDRQMISASPRKSRLLSKKEANRMWGLTTVPGGQTRSDTWNLGSQSLDTVPKQSKVKGAFEESFSRAIPAVTAHLLLQPASDTVVQTSAVVRTPQSSYPKLTDDTPQDRRTLEFVLDYRLDPGPGLRALWVHSMISRMLTWVDPLGLRLHPTPPSDEKQLPLLIIRDKLTHTSKCEDRFARDYEMASGIVSLCAQRSNRNEPAGVSHHPTTSSLGLSSRTAATSAMTGTSLTSKPSAAGSSSTFVAVRKARRGRGTKRSATTPPRSPLDNMGEPNSLDEQLVSTLRDCTAGTLLGEEITTDLDDLAMGKTTLQVNNSSTIHASPVLVSAACITAVEVLPPTQVQALEEANTRVERPACSRSGTVTELESIHTLSQRMEFSGQCPHELKANAPPQGDIRVFVIWGQEGRLVADRSSLQLPLVGDYHRGEENTTCTARCLVNLGLAGVVSVRLPTVAPPTDEAQVMTASKYSEPVLVHRRRRRRHRHIGGSIKPTSESRVAGEHSAVIQVVPAPLQYSAPNTESWGERRARRLGTGSSPPRFDGNEDNSSPNALLTINPSGGYPPEDLREAPFGQPRHLAYSLSPSTEEWADMGGCLDPDSIKGNADCRVPRWESESQAQSAFSDCPGEGTKPSLVPASVEVSLERGGRKCTFELRKSDWDDAHAQGMSEHSDIVIGLAWRRFVMTQQGQRVILPTIRLVSREAIDLPKNSWPTSWEGLLAHVNTGGFFRSISTLKGGMNQEMQALLDSTVFDDNLPWEAIDRDLASVRSGAPASQTDTIHLAQALASCTGLQQWNCLETTLRTLLRDEPNGWVLTPARLAALSVVASRRRAPDPGPPGQPLPWWTTGAYVEIRINHLSPEDFAPDPRLTSNLRGQVLDGIVSRLLRLFPAISDHDRFCLQDLREDLRLELNYKDPGLFSTTLVVPNGPWITALLEGTVSFGGQSFCILVPTDLFIETEVSNADQQAIRAIRALGNHANAHPWPVPVGVVGAAAGAPDNPNAAQH